MCSVYRLIKINSANIFCIHSYTGRGQMVCPGGLIAQTDDASTPTFCHNYVLDGIVLVSANVSRTLREHSSKTKFNRWTRLPGIYNPLVLPFNSSNIEQMASFE